MKRNRISYNEIIGVKGNNGVLVSFDGHDVAEVWETPRGVAIRPFNLAVAWGLISPAKLEGVTGVRVTYPRGITVARVATSDSMAADIIAAMLDRLDSFPQAVGTEKTAIEAVREGVA